MVLSRVLAAIFKYNIILITTSNVCPDDLYKNGLQRNLFMPAIESIKTNLDIVHLSGDVDYRAKMLMKASCYFYPDSEYNYNKLKEIFCNLSNMNISIFESNYGQSANQMFIDISDREVAVVAIAEYIVWFDFNILCNSPRSHHDYIETAEIYKVLLLSKVQQLDDNKLDIVRRFISLIDILYDYKVKLIICSSVAIGDIYIGQTLSFEFKRTISRLKEMQTEQYVSMAHL